MSNQTGLADRERFEAFRQQWRGSVLREAEKWCDEPQTQELLADAVLADFRKRYAFIDPPQNLEFSFRAQVCLVYSLTGQNVRKLEQYLEEQAIPEAVKAPAEDKLWADVPPETEEASVEAWLREEEPEAATPAPAPAPASEPKPAPEPEPKPAPAPESGKPAATADTFYDPVRTTFWTPDSEKNEHVVRELELPDEEEDERSVVLSFINMMLFLCTIGAFGFCVYETGFFQYLLQ